MRPLLLKAGATLLTLLAAGGSAGYVAGHLKTGGAPLHPAVVGQPADTGRLVLSPSVKSGEVAAVTSTHAS